MVAIRTEATQCGHTIVNQALGTGAAACRRRGGSPILGHGGVGVVEGSGATVTCSPGDRVSSRTRRTVANLRLPSRTWRPLPDEPIGSPTAAADRRTRRRHAGPSAQQHRRFRRPDDYVRPVLRAAHQPAGADLAVLGCVGATGLGAVTTFVPVRFGETSWSMGAGPLGLRGPGSPHHGASRSSASSRLPRAARWLPGWARRCSRSECRRRAPGAEDSRYPQRTDRNCSADWIRQRRDSRGADCVVATVGADTLRPTVERGPDPTRSFPRVRPGR